MRADQTPFIRTIKLKDRSGRVVGEKEVVLYAGLLNKAHDDGLKSLRTRLLQIPAKDNGGIAIAKARVETSKGVFEGIGDASPDNVTSFVVPHLIRMAETRAKARALRDAVNVGVISFEELDGEGLESSGGSDLGSGASAPARSPTRRAAPAKPRGENSARATNGNGEEPMTESQRRYLFRLLAGKGVKPEAVEEKLKARFKVAELSKVTKTAAAKLIDELLHPAPEKGAGNGAAPHPVR